MQLTAVIILSFIYIYDCATIGRPRATIKKGKLFCLSLSKIFRFNYSGEQDK